MKDFIMNYEKEIYDHEEKFDPHYDGQVFNEVKMHEQNNKLLNKKETINNLRKLFDELCNEINDEDWTIWNFSINFHSRNEVGDEKRIFSSINEY